MEKVVAGLTAAGKDLDGLTVDDLAPIDEFHTRGRESTLEVAELAGLTDEDSVLDVGCGIGGSSRHIARKYPSVRSGVGIKLSPVQAERAQRLSDAQGLGGKLRFQVGRRLGRRNLGGVTAGRQRYDNTQ